MSISGVPLSSSSSSPIRSKPAIETAEPITSSTGEIGTTTISGQAQPIREQTYKPIGETGSGAVSHEQNEPHAGESSESSEGDRVEISPEALKRRDQTTENESPLKSDQAEEKKDSEKVSSDKEEEGLTESEKDLVKQLKARDAEVRVHEQAHLSAAGDLANGSAKFDYQTGPDGHRYAIGGSVNIDVSAASDPEETLARADRIKRSALAPAEPSSKDRQVASKADALKVQAQREIAEARLEEQAEKTEESQDKEGTGVQSSSIKKEEEGDQSPLQASQPSKGTYNFSGRNNQESQGSLLSLIA